MVPFDSFLGRTEVARQRLAAVKERARAFAGEDAGKAVENRRAWQEHLRRLSMLENRFGRGIDAEVERDLERERAVGQAIGYDGEADARSRAARWVLRTAEALEAALEVRDFRLPGPPPPSQAGGLARAELDLFSRGRSDDPAGISGLAQRDQREANLRLWDLLRSGDGAALADRMRSKGLDGRGVIENARGVAGGRDELTAWLRWSYPAACSTCGLYPLANRTASRIDAARTIDDPGGYRAPDVPERSPGAAGQEHLAAVGGKGGPVRWTAPRRRCSSCSQHRPQCQEGWS